jgi:hypothetical protein
MRALSLFFVLVMFLITLGWMQTASADALLDSNTIHSAGWDKLTEIQKAAIIKQVTEGAAQTNNSGLPAADEAQKWVNVSSGIGKGLVAMVKELGVTINEFITTPAGILAMGMLVWHVMGNEIIHVVYGSILFVVWVPIWIHMYRTVCIPKKKVTMERTGMFNWKRTIEYGLETDAMTRWRIGLMAAFVFMAAITFWIM